MERRRNDGGIARERLRRLNAQRTHVGPALGGLWPARNSGVRTVAGVAVILEWRDDAGSIASGAAAGCQQQRHEANVAVASTGAGDRHRGRRDEREHRDLHERGPFGRRGAARQRCRWRVESDTPGASRLSQTILDINPIRSGVSAAARQRQSPKKTLPRSRRSGSDAGGEPDATCRAHDHADTTLGLLVTSAHPAAEPRRSVTRARATRVVPSAALTSDSSSIRKPRDSRTTTENHR
jgi:hypothetical protein